MTRWPPAAFCLWLPLLAAWHAEAQELPFRVSTLPSAERTVLAEIADLDGDGRSDLLLVAFDGVPPRERRILRIHLQGSDGLLPPRPSLEQALPGEAAAYDVADVRGGPGCELLLLEREGVAMLSFERNASEGLALAVRRVRLPSGGSTVGAARDERGLDRLELVHIAAGGEVLIVVPGFRETFLFTPDGELVARLAVGGRANYIVNAPGPMLAESAIQLYYDPPRIFFGEVNGDGRLDLVAPARHELRVFLGRPDGGFSSEPERRHWLGLVSEQDHIRGTGAVRSAAQDIDGDGLLDLLITHSSGSLLGASSTSAVHFNRGGEWDLTRPDATFPVGRGLSADQLADVNGDGRLELVQVSVPLSVLELVEVFLTSSIDARLRVYTLEPAADGSPATPEEGASAQLDHRFDIPLDFETGRSHGFVSTLAFDLNGDGYRDFLSSSDGGRIEVSLGGAGEGFARGAAQQEVATTGRVRSGDWDGDGILDLVLYNPRKPGQPVLLLENRRQLPGTTPGGQQLRALPDVASPR